MKYFYLLFFVSFFYQIDAQWNASPYINTAICTASFKQKEVKLSSDGDGGAFIVWRDHRSGSFVGTPDIYIQKVDSNGIPQWTIDGTSLCMLPSSQSTPNITTDEKGGVIIAWSDRRNDVINRDIYAQRIDANGNILWPINGVPVCTKPNNEHSPKIISDDHSGIIVVWEDQRNDETYDIWAQRVDSSGNVLWQQGGVPVCLADSSRLNPKVQRNRDGGAIITWQDKRSGEYDIYAQNIDSNGVLLWGNNAKPICLAPNTQSNPKIDPEKEANGVFITWVDKRNNVDYDIYSNRVDSNGNVLWGNAGKPVVVSSGNQSALDILSNNKTKGLIITWKDNRSSEYDIYVQKLDMDGNPAWQNNGIVVCNALTDQKNPNIISDKNGGAIITWQDLRNGNWDIFCQRVGYNGNLIWQNNGVPVSLADEDQVRPKNIPDNKGGTIIAWEDKRNGFSKDIYIHHLLFEDTVTYIIDTIIEPIDTIIDTIDTTNIFVLESDFVNVYPNPFKNKIILEFNKDRSSNFDFKLIDILGREIQIESLEDYKNKIVINVNINSIENGTCFLIVQTEKSVSSIPLVKD